MDTDRLIQLAPHYAAMLLLVFLALSAVRAVVGELSFWVELAIILVVVLPYRPAVVQLGLAPSSWE